LIVDTHTRFGDLPATVAHIRRIVPTGNRPPPENQAFPFVSSERPDG
jgi:hypothetical protein